MLRSSLYWLCGAYALQFCTNLPSSMPILCGVLIALLCGLFKRGRPALLVTAGAACMWYAADRDLADRLTPALQGKTLTIEAHIVDFPKEKLGSTRLLVTPLTPLDLPQRVRLSWYGVPETVSIDEVWQLRVRLRRPRGFSNPAGFDFSGWLHRQRVGATGYVVAHDDNARIAPASNAPRASLRQRLHERLDELLPNDDARAVVKAISIGARGDISSAQWRLYARTGTSHLMAISGLHIGLAASGAFLLAWLLLSPLSARHNIRDLALAAAIVAALCYAALSGFAVPARRAFLMALLVGGGIVLRRRISPGHVLGCACIVIAATDPLSLYAPGFILSFAAVALLLWSGRSLNPRTSALPAAVSLVADTLRQLSRIQLVLMFGLLPLTVALFGRIAWFAPAANLLVLPVFNLITVPAALLGLCFGGFAAGLGDLLLMLSYQSVKAVLAILTLADRHLPLDLEPAVSGYAVLTVAAATMLWSLLPASWPGRQLAPLAAIATVLHKPAMPPVDCVSVRVLDVGQGLSVILQTRHRVVIYDTGPAFRGGSSSAQLVIAPYLQSLGLTRPDLLILSHSDLDHAGGIGYLSSRFSIGRVLSGEPQQTGGDPCLAAADWQWDGVSFRFLHPQPAGGWLGNNASCVLEVQVGKHKLLIPGDIESQAENELLATQRLGAVDTVLVPHHGSRTSSSPAFVARLSPRLAIVSAGYGNRWGFPKSDVVERWEGSGARVLSTAEHGSIATQFCRGQEIASVRLHRQDARRYWHD